MDHAIWADPGLMPGLRGDEMGIQDQDHSTGNELVEILDRDLDRFSLVQFEGDRIAIHL